MWCILNITRSFKAVWEIKEILLSCIIITLLNIYFMQYLYELGFLPLSFAYSYHVIIGLMLIMGLFYSVKSKIIINLFYRNKVLILIYAILGISSLLLKAWEMLVGVFLLMICPLYFYIVRKVSLYNSIKKYKIKEIRMKLQGRLHKALASLVEEYRRSIDSFMEEEFSFAIVKCIKGIETLLKTTLTEEIKDYIEKKDKRPGFKTLMKIFVEKYLAEAPKEARNRLVDEAEEVYKIRSKHVHGEEIKPPKTIKEKALEIPLLKGFVEYFEALHVIAYTNELLKLINNAYAKQ